ncbi:MAG: division/cell wall cluster transcriptional repressor MraZ [Microthrixaceae bacterium]
MESFWEYNEHNIDGKGRLVLPSTFRANLEGGGVLTWMGRRLAIYPPAVWEARLRKLSNDPAITPRQFSLLRSYVTAFTPDSQNRVTIPARLREQSGLDRSVALIGMGDHIDLYDLDAWKALEVAEATEELYDRLTEAN